LLDVAQGFDELKLNQLFCFTSYHQSSLAILIRLLGSQVIALPWCLNRFHLHLINWPPCAIGESSISLILCFVTIPDSSNMGSSTNYEC
jgi:hypothetical protein